MVIMKRFLILSCCILNITLSAADTGQDLINENQQPISDLAVQALQLLDNDQLRSGEDDAQFWQRNRLFDFLQDMDPQGKDPDCVALRAWAYLMGYGVHIDKTKAKKLLETVRGQSLLAKIFYEFMSKGRANVLQDLERVSEFFELRTGQRSAELNSILSFAYLNGFMGAEQSDANVQLGYKLALQSFEGGSQYGRTRLAYCLERGLGVSKNFMEAVELNRESADSGLALAQFNTSILLRQLAQQRAQLAQQEVEGSVEQGNLLQEQSKLLQDARGYLEASARQGYAFALYNLGSLLVQEQSVHEAVEYLLEAARQEHDGACYLLGVIYFKSKYKKEALKYFELAVKYSDPAKRKTIQLPKGLTPEEQKRILQKQHGGRLTFIENSGEGEESEAEVESEVEEEVESEVEEESEVKEDEKMEELDDLSEAEKAIQVFLQENPQQEDDLGHLREEERTFFGRLLSQYYQITGEDARRSFEEQATSFLSSLRNNLSRTHLTSLFLAARFWGVRHSPSKL